MRNAGVNYEQHVLYPQYEALWRQSLPHLRLGQLTYDEHLIDKEQDGRRGLTVIARLAPDVAERIAETLQTLAAIEPRQYYYPRADIHLTVLSLFTATEHYQPQLDRLGDYRAAVASVLQSTRSFVVDMAGITLSTSAVLAQGFPHDATLDSIRDRLRAALVAYGLGASLDQRYRLVTAHSTLARFATALGAPDRFARALADHRHTLFGRSVITSLDLVFNDWYMSFDKLTTVDSHQLTAATR